MSVSHQLPFVTNWLNGQYNHITQSFVVTSDVSDVTLNVSDVTSDVSDVTSNVTSDVSDVTSDVTLDVLDVTSAMKLSNNMLFLSKNG